MVCPACGANTRPALGEIINARARAGAARVAEEEALARIPKSAVLIREHQTRRVEAAREVESIMRDHERAALAAELTQERT